MSENRKPEQGVKLRGAEKVARIPVKVVPTVEAPRKPDWIRVKMAAPDEVQRINKPVRISVESIKALIGSIGTGNHLVLDCCIAELRRVERGHKSTPGQGLPRA